jgi:hypothetical protein
VRSRRRAVAALGLNALVSSVSQRAHHDHVRARRPAGIGVDDIGEDAGDVVRPTAANRQIDELADCLIEIGDLCQCLVHGLVADHVSQAV